MRPRRDTDPEAGVTLVELLMAVAILGIVAIAITGAILVGLRTFGGTDNKIRSSTDAQFVGIHLPADLQSVGNAAGDLGVDTAHLAAGSTPGANYTALANDQTCSENGTANVLRLRWIERRLDATQTYIAAYTVVAGKDGAFLLQRTYCVPGTPPVRTTVARNIKSPADVSVLVQDPKVTLKAVSKAQAPADPTSYAYSISGTRRTR